MCVEMRKIIAKWFFCFVDSEKVSNFSSRRNETWRNIKYLSCAGIALHRMFLYMYVCVTWELNVALEKSSSSTCFQRVLSFSLPPSSSSIAICQFSISPVTTFQDYWMSANPRQIGAKSSKSTCSRIQDFESCVSLIFDRSGFGSHLIFSGEISSLERYLVP